MNLIQLIFYLFMCRYFLIDLIDDSTQITKISQKNQGKNEQRTFVGPLQTYTWGVFFFVILYK